MQATSTAPVITGLGHQVDTDMFGIPVMPNSLAPFMREMSPEDIMAAAQVAYNVWEASPATQLKDELYGSSACHDSGIEFGVDPVDAQDYDFSVQDLSDPAFYEFTFDNATNDIRMAVAKRACSSCPVIAQCLAVSMIEMRHGRQVAEESGVWGGVGRTGRLAVLPVFESMLDAYDARTAEEEGAAAVA